MLNNKFIYLDNASSTYKSLSVIKKLNDFYKNGYVLQNKGIYNSTIKVSKTIEEIKLYISKFINSDYN